MSEGSQSPHAHVNTQQKKRRNNNKKKKNGECSLQVVTWNLIVSPVLLWLLVTFVTLYVLLSALLLVHLFCQVFRWVPDFYCSFFRHSLNVLVINPFPFVAIAGSPGQPVAAG